MGLLKKIKTTSDEFNLITKSDSILVALSGGPDSVALLHLLTKLQKEYQLSLSAIYINHQIRKTAAKKEEKFCQNLCDNLGIELFIVSEDIPLLAKKTKKGIEETARDYRYGIFEMLAKEHAFSKVALGHHLNDRVETILFRIFRGTGRSGLKGIPPKRDIYIRPLYDITKPEILKYLSSHALTYCNDLSNLKSDFKRNYIRNKLLPSIEKNLNPAVEKAILTLSETISEEEQFLESLTSKQLKKMLSVTPGQKILLNRDIYAKNDKWLRRRILRYCLTEYSENNLAPDKDVIDRFDNMILNKGKALSLPNRMQARLTGDQIIIYSNKKLSYNQKLNLNDCCCLNKIDYIVICDAKNRADVTVRKEKRALFAQFDLSKLTPPFSIRNIKEGDRFSPLGLKGSKKIGNYLTDSKIDPVFRDEIPVMTDKNGIFWLVGCEIDNRAKIDRHTKEVIEIEFSRRKKI